MDSTGYRLGEDRYAQTKIKERRVRAMYLLIRGRGCKGWKASMGGVRVIEKWGRWEMVAFFLLCPFVSFLLLFKGESFSIHLFFLCVCVDARCYPFYLRATSLSSSLPLPHICLSGMKRRGSGVQAQPLDHSSEGNTMFESKVFLSLCVCVCACVFVCDCVLAL